MLHTKVDGDKPPSSVEVAFVFVSIKISQNLHSVIKELINATISIYVGVINGVKRYLVGLNR